jgi:hypothetical protein
VYSKKVDQQFAEIKSEITGIKSEITGIKSDIVSIRSEMVTKDYLTEKLADLRGDLILTMRGEDKKVLTLVDMLRQKNILTPEEVKQILAMRPFPQTI